MNERKGLGLGDMDDFAPRRERSKAPTRVVEQATSWRSREAPAEISQINIRGDKRVLERYKALCETHGRRTYIEMLEILMDRMEG